jgi:hypothetical protein
VNESDLKSEFKGAEQDCIGYLSGQLASERELALKYYLGQPFGNEIQGRSKIVSTEVSDVVEWMLPSLLRVFSAGSQTVRFEPNGPEDEQQAAQATDYCNHIFNSDNPGFQILHTWFKDALLQKNGMVKVWWEEADTVTTEFYPGLDEPSFAQLIADPEVEPTNHTVNEDGTHDVNVRKKAKSGKVCITPVPPEQFLISRNAKDIPSARFVGNRDLKSISDLRAMKVSEDVLKRLAAAGDDGDNQQTDTQAVARDLYDENTGQGGGPGDEASRKVWVTDGWLRVDFDNDGIAELRHITMAGNEIIFNETDDVAPFADITPIPMPHRWVGRSMADITMDLQLLKSTVWRQMMDNLYLSTSPMMLVDESVNLDDLLNPRPGGIVRIQSMQDGVNNHARPIEVPFTAGHAFPMLEHIDMVRESRTGVTKYNQGLDANSLNKTATGIQQIMNASQSRLELVGRHFAEGVRQMFKLILRCVVKYQQQERIVRLRNRWVPVNPRDWSSQMDCSVLVGLGTGDKQQQLGALMNILQVQQAAFAGQGQLGVTLVRPENLFHTLSRMVEASGFKEPAAFFTDPAGQQPQPPPPNPEIQATMMKTQADIEATKAKTQAGIQATMMKAQADVAIKSQQAQQEGVLAQFTAQQEAQAHEQEMVMDARERADAHAGKMEGVRLDHIVKLAKAAEKPESRPN